MEHAWEIRARVQFEGDAHVIEDACGFFGRHAWVIDGATPLLEQIGLPAASDPQWLAQMLSLSFAAESQAAKDSRGLLAAALARIDTRGTDLVGAELTRFPSAAVSVATLNDAGVEVASLADCTVVVRTADDGTHVVRAELADARVELHAARHAVDGAERRRLLLLDRELRNTPGNLWVARREPEAAAHAHVVQLGPPETMVMASDGAWRAVDLGLVSGPAEFLDRAGDPVGALKLMTELRVKQAEIGEPADDATVLALAPAARP